MTISILNDLLLFSCLAAVVTGDRDRSRKPALSAMRPSPVPVA
jgi:hypothetical protein